MPFPTATEPPPRILTVVWAEAGDLLVWREDEPTARRIASGGVIQPYLASDGGHIAFTRGAQGDAISLWAISSDGVGEEVLVAPDVIPSIRNGHPQIDQVKWLDDHTVYFNTRQVYESGVVPDDNLYRVELGGEPQLILPPGAGGEFALSPDGEEIAVAAAGRYGLMQGHVTLLDPAGQTVREVMYFDAVNPEDEAPFYPPLTWNSGSSAVYTAIPEFELRPGGQSPATVTLWRADADGVGRIMGMVYAALTLPTWSDQAGSLLYVRLNDNRRELVVAAGNGENAQVYATDATNPRWIPGDRFVYERDGALWLGREGQTPLRLLDTPAQRILYLPDGAFVFAADGALLRGFQSEQPDTITPLAENAAFDAVVAP